MTSTARNRLITKIKNIPSTTGNFVIDTATPGYRTFSISDDGLSFDISVTDGLAWEVRTGCVYTHSNKTLSRGTLEDSSSGQAIGLSIGAIVTCSLSASVANKLIGAVVLMPDLQLSNISQATSIINTQAIIASHIAFTETPIQFVDGGTP